MDQETFELALLDKTHLTDAAETNAVTGDIMYQVMLQLATIRDAKENGASQGELDSHYKAYGKLRANAEIEFLESCAKHEAKKRVAA